MERRRDTETHRESLRYGVTWRHGETHGEAMRGGGTWRDGETQRHMKRH